jgi:hypothetical protein
MQKTFPKLMVLLLIATVLSLSSGCSSRKGVMNPYKKRDFNLLGIVQHKPYSFNPVAKTSIPISYHDVLFNRENFTGRELNLLWGLVTITDY